MKRAINLRLEENIIVALNQLSQEFHTTKTDIIEKAISSFWKQNHLQQNQLLEFAGKLSSRDADMMLENIRDDKNSKEFHLDI